MTEDIKKWGVEDSTLVDLHDMDKMDYWGERFGISTVTLRIAISEAGQTIKDLRHWLHINGYIKAID